MILIKKIDLQEDEYALCRLMIISNVFFYRQERGARVEVDFGLKETSTNWLPLGVARIYSIGECQVVAVLYFLVRCLYYVLYFLVRFTDLCETLCVNI